MAQERADKVQPVARGYATLTNMLATQNLLPDQSHHDCVFDVVVGRIGVGDVLYGRAADEREDTRVSWLQHAIRAHVHRLKFVHECLDHDLRRIKHDGYRRQRSEVGNKIAYPLGGYWRQVWRLQPLKSQDAEGTPTTGDGAQSNSRAPSTLCAAP